MFDEELPEVEVLLCKTNSRKDLESYIDDSGEDTGRQTDEGRAFRYMTKYSTLPKIKSPALYAFCVYWRQVYSTKH